MRVPIDELRKLPEFGMLPESQQKFLEEYIAKNYDAKAALVAAYPKAKTPESIRVMACRLMNTPGIVMLLHLHYGDEPKDSFCKMVAQMIRRRRISKEQLSLIRLLAQVRGFVDPWSPRYDKKIEPHKVNTREAVKRRSQRAAQREEKDSSAGEGDCGPSLLGEFSKL